MALVILYLNRLIVTSAYSYSSLGMWIFRPVSHLSLTIIHELISLSLLGINSTHFSNWAVVEG
jgi:branched-subunit amino acid transport protein